jgi:predicted AAA+ superfamily ATPase
MKRDIEKDLLIWKEQKNHLPILLRGARQVGKSYLIENFGKQHFDNILVVNFELEPRLNICFESLNPNEIIQKLSILMRHEIQPNKTLLFLDEIQDCPNAIRSLRYFKEQLPELHVIGAGSLLEFTLNDAEFRMPVGRIQSLYLNPLSFKEFLTGTHNNALRALLEQANLEQTIEPIYHNMLLEQVKSYMALGGMPGVLSIYTDSEVVAHGQMAPGYDLEECRLMQATLLSTYRNDFGKYAKHSQIKQVQSVFEKAPGMIGDHFKYSKVDPDVRSYQIKQALELLEDARLIHSVYSTAASGIPLATLVNEKKFKIIFLDIGLMGYASHISAEWLLKDIILLNRGAMAEQFVGQELLAYSPIYEEGHLYFWCREKKSSMAEVDFLTTVGAQIIPIEVKTGSTGQLKSLHLLMNEKNLKLGIRISQNPLSFDGKILSVPFYMVGEIPRLVRM